jgi:signal transduction histidine kinase
MTVLCVEGGSTPSPATSIAELRRLTTPELAQPQKFNLEGAVCWHDPERHLVALQDATGGAMFEILDPQNVIQPGQRIRLEGICSLEGIRFKIYTGLEVDNDGLHAAQEVSGSVFLLAGKQPIRIAWFNKTKDAVLRMACEGPDLPRQPVEDLPLFHPSPDPQAGQTNWVKGLTYRCYEGDWHQVPDYEKMVPVKSGTASNLNLEILTRTELAGVQFKGYVEIPREGIYTFYCTSDDGCRVNVGQQEVRIEVLATNAFPDPRPLALGKPLEANESLWSEVEGKAGFVSRTDRGLVLELRSATGKLEIEVARAQHLAPALVSGSQLRITGFCPAAYTRDGHLAPGRLLVPGPEFLRFERFASQHWKQFPQASLADYYRMPGTNLAGTIGHLRGTVRGNPLPGGILLVDAGNEVLVEPWQPTEFTPGTEVEVLGEWHWESPKLILRSAFCRQTEARLGNKTGVLPKLDVIQQVHQLTREEAGMEHPVQVRGVVTYQPAGSFNAVVQDATRGVYVADIFGPGQAPVEVGDYLEIEGVTGPGDFAPIISAKRVVRLGAGRPPDLAHVSYDQLMNGSMDCQYTELEGIVTSVRTNTLSLLLSEGPIQVEVEPRYPVDLSRCQDARIRIRGCLLAAWDGQTHEVKSGIINMVSAVVSIEEMPLSDPFAGRTKLIGELFQFDARASSLHRIKVAGQILHRRGNDYYMTDGTNGLRFQCRVPAAVELGDQVEVTGFAELGGPSPVLKEAMLRRIGAAPLPTPRPLTADALLSSSNDAALVAVESRLISQRSNQNDLLLEVQAGPRLFFARLATNHGQLPQLAVGSQLRLTGVYVGHGGNRFAGKDMDSFELLLNSNSDITVLDEPSWWTAERTFAVVGGLCAVLVLAAAWILSLRREVEQRTGQLRQEIEERKRTGEQLEEKARLLAAEIEERKRVQAEIERIHQQLLVTSRQAGMAEVATSVLHNVGNVLNSVNVSASLVTDRIRNSKSGSLRKVAALLEAHAGDLGTFLTQDPRGQQLPAYLDTLAKHLAEEQSVLIKELRSLNQNIEHIKDIVSMQQNYARISGVTETVHPQELVEDALRMHAGGLSRHDIQVFREYDSHAPAVTVDKHKVLQVLVNLVHNAKYACDESGRTDKRLTLRVTNGDDRVRISVEDNGIGIPPENLTRIFSHGFTTRRNGHGFGLHSGALAAKELGGALHVHSDGAGTGAIFCLELPLRPPPGNGKPNF